MKRKASSPIKRAVKKTVIDLVTPVNSPQSPPYQPPSPAEEKLAPPSEHPPCILQQPPPRAPPALPRRDVQLIFDEIRDVEDELGEWANDTADPICDEDCEPTGGYEPNENMPANELPEFNRWNNKLLDLYKELDQAQDLIKDGVMKWVEAEWDEYQPQPDRSTYYYYYNNESAEVIMQGWWQFTHPLDPQQQKHYEEFEHDYFYYERPIYQDALTSEYTDGALCFEDGVRSLWTHDEYLQFKKKYQ